MTNGKTNQDARLEERCVFRAKDVEVCAWSAIALLDFERFHTGSCAFGPQGLAFPDLSTSAGWFHLKVFPSPKNLEAPLTYETHYKAMERMISDLNIPTSKVTHLGRGTGANAAQIRGQPLGRSIRLAAGKLQRQPAAVPMHLASPWTLLALLLASSPRALSFWNAQSSHQKKS